MSQQRFPRARSTDLILQPIDQEMLVYDGTTERAYVLNPTAGAVWRACDGKRSASDIASYLSQQTPTTELTVWYALGQIQELLEDPVELPKTLWGISRREFLKRAGLVGAAVTIPVIVSMVAPAAAHAQSAGTVCCVCTNGSTLTSLTGCASCVSACITFGGFDHCGSLTECQD